MKRYFFALSLIGFIASPNAFGASPNADKFWVSDPVGTWMEISFSHSNLFMNTSTIPNCIATLHTHGAALETAQLDISCAPGSLWSHSTLFSRTLKGPGFFNVDPGSVIYFKSTNIRPKGKDEYKVTGDLKMNSVTRSVTLGMTASKIVPWEAVQFRSFTLNGNVDRKNYGMAFQEPKELENDPLFGNSWDIKFTVEVTDKPNASEFTQPSVQE